MFDVAFAQAWGCVVGERVLCFAAVLSGLRLVGAILQFRGGSVLVFLEFSDNVPGHGDVKRSLVVIPLESNCAVEISVPIYGEFIFLLDARNEVVNIFLMFIFYTKIIDGKREGDGPGCVFPKRFVCTQSIMGGKAFLE